MPDERQLAAMRISEVLNQWPQAAEVFQKHAMACVGCAVAPFFTIADAVAVYGLQEDEFLTELVEVINRPVSRDLDPT